MRTRWLLSIAIVILALFTGAPAAHAVCTNPDGAAGSIVFNKDHQVMQYCDDTNWRQIGPSPRKPTGCPNIGDICSDNTYFIGDIGAGPVYATDETFESTETWNDGNTNYSTTGATSNTDGEGNAASLVTADSDDVIAGTQPHDAAIYCDSLSAHGHDDWYLPAMFELGLFWNGGAPVANIDESGNFYWSSSEDSSDNARLHNFDFGIQNSIFKHNNLAVRCVRREGTKLTSIIPDGLVGHWKLDEADFPYKDSSLTGADAINSGGTDPVSVPGRLSDGLDFLNESSRRISTDTSSVYAGLTTLTISAWIKSDDVAGGGYNGIIDIEGIAGLYVGWNSNRLSFHADGWDAQSGSWRVYDRLASNQWHHVAVTYDTTAPSGTKPTIYINGVGDDDPGTSFTGTGSFINPASSVVTIGAFDTSGWRGFNGEIDDVRIYDRILSADEIHYLYQSFDKNVKYDADRRVPKYFNGEEWVAMGPSKYVPNAVHFEPTEYISKSGASTNDTKAITGSFWIKATGTGLIDIASGVGGGNGFRIQRANVGKRFVISGLNTAGSNILSIDTASFPTVLPWTHVLFSFDLSDPAKRHIYVNDVDSLDTVSSYVDDFIEMTDHTFYIGSRDSTGGAGDNEYFADFWLAADTYIDLSIEANRRKFIDEYGDPVYLGATGSLPTGSSPDIFLSGDTDSWHVNKGTGGGFTEGGALEDAITKPGGPFLPADGLVGYWKLDEVSGSSVIDYASANNGTYRNSGGPANVNSQSGVHGGALDFSPELSNEVDLGRPSDLDMSGTNAFTISAWVKPNDTHDGTVFSRGAVQSSEENTVYYLRKYLDTDRWNVVISDGVTACNALTPVGTVEFGSWQHIAATWDGTNLAIYKDGTGLDSAICAISLWDGGGTGVNRDTAIGADARSNRKYWDGIIDDVAIYDRALSPAEITNMYNAGTCANPERLNGTIVYNADFNVMQYCDAVRSGDGWQAVGP